MDAEIKRTVISNIGFKIRDTTAAQPGWREEREITGDSAQFAMPWPTGRPEDFRIQEMGNHVDFCLEL